MISRKVKQAHQQLYDFWRRVSNSTHCHMSRGAEYLARIIPYGHKDTWRRKNPKK
jgi:hypothetical protein